MAVSFTFTGTKYTFTISGVQNAITISDADRNKKYSQLYSKPTVKRDITGSAITRYINIAYGYKTGDYFMLYADVWYKAVFTSSGKTATVTEYNTANAGPLGEIVDQQLQGRTINKVTCGMFTSTSGDVIGFDYKSATISRSGWSPTAMSITANVTQTSPDPLIFGKIAGFCKVSFQATGGNLWTYSLNGRSGTIMPSQIITLAGNDTTTTKTGYSTQTITISEKTVSADVKALTANATITNELNNSQIKSSMTVPDVQFGYTAPIASNISIERSGTSFVCSFGWRVSSYNCETNVTNPVTTGTIVANWSMKDNTTGNIVRNGVKTIVADGSTTNTSGTDTITDSGYVYDTERSYTISLFITDRLGGVSQTYTAILATEFYIIDFKSGGHGVAFGKPSTTDDLFDCGLDANFDGDISTDGNVNSGGNISTDGTINSGGDISTNGILYSGDIHSSGYIYARGHSAAIGANSSDSTSASKNISTAGSPVMILSHTFTEAGVWVVIGGVQFSANSSSYRRINIRTSSANTAIQVQAGASSSGVTRLECTKIISIDSGATVYLNAQSGVGGLTASGTLEWVRIR